MLHEEYVKKYSWQRVDFDASYWFQCVDLARHYVALVWWWTTWAFGWSAISWRYNRDKTFPWKRSITGFPNDTADIKKWDIVIFKPYAKVMVKSPWSQTRRQITLTQHGHVWVVDYIDNDWVIRLLEQNGWTGNGNWLWNNAIRLYWYKGKLSVAWFILQ